MRTRAPLVSPHLKRPLRSLAFLAACGLAAGTLACNREPTAPGALGGQLRADRGTSNVGSVVVTVLHSQTAGGGAADGYAVSVINVLDGTVYPGISGADASGTGTVTIDNLPVPGSYCVDVLPVGSDSFPSAALNQVPPPDSIRLAPVDTTDAAVLLGSSGTPVTLNATNFLASCTDPKTAPITLKNRKPVEDTLTLIAGTNFTATVDGLDGSQIGTNGYVGIPLDWSQLPPAWKPSGLAGDIEPLILVAANPSDGTVPLVVDPAVADSLRFESDFIPLTYDVHLTTAGLTFAVADNTVASFSLGSEPLLCAWDTVGEASGDNNVGKVDLQSPVEEGYQATTDLQPEPNAAAVWFNEVGDGDITFSLRDRLPGSTLTFQSTVTCTGGTCPASTEKVTGSLLSVSGFSHTVVSDRLGTSDGARITYTVQGLPSDSVEWSVSTAGDQIPDASKFDQSSAFVALYTLRPKLSDCPANTNDLRWTTF